MYNKNAKYNSKHVTLLMDGIKFNHVLKPIYLHGHNSLFKGLIKVGK